MTFVLTGGYVAYALSPVGPPMWRNTPSLRWLNALLPSWLMCGLFVVYVALHLAGGLRPAVVGSLLGLALYFVGLIALIVTIRFDRPSNPIALAAVILACVLHYLAARLAMIQGARE